MDYTNLYLKAKAQNHYQMHIAGDTSCFRYPHLEKWQSSFSFERKLQTFLFEGSADTLREIAAEDITVYEFITPQSKKIHLSDMLGCPVSQSDKQAAMQQVAEAYRRKKELFSSAQIETISASQLPLREDFSSIRKQYSDYMDIPIYVVKMRQKGFPFGSVLKGTNIIITDQSAYNLSQDVLHMLFHLKEGIPGADNDNMYVRELWAEVPELYALQLCEGRLARRTRLRPSPHPIHFTDYIFLRAFLGQAFLDKKAQDEPHPVYSYISPSVAPMFYALAEYSAEERNRIFADAVLCDKTTELTAAVERCFGQGSFRHIYDQYSLYDKYRLASDHMDKTQLDEIVFSGKLMPHTGVSDKAIREHWRKAIDENTVMLPAGIV